MQVLEKILEEIEQAKKESLFRLCDYTYKDRQERIINRIEDIIRSHMKDEPVSNPNKLDNGWIPADQPPEDDRYILLSFANFSVPMVGRYEESQHGDGAYYLGDCDEEDTCMNQDLFVNAWQPLPKPYQEKED